MKEDFKTVLKECENLKGEVTSYIILAVTNEKLSGKVLGGINSVNGSEPELINLLLNLDKDLFAKAVIARAMSFNCPDDEEEKPELLN